MKSWRKWKRPVRKFGASRHADSLAALRAKPADELLKASAALSFPPNVDGWLLPEDVYTIFEQGKQNDVPPDRRIECG